MLQLNQIKQNNNGSYTDSKGNTLSESDVAAQYSLMSDYEDATTDLNVGLNNGELSENDEKIWDKYKHIFGVSLLPNYNEPAYDHAQGGTGGWFEGQNWFNKLGRNQHSLKNSKLLMNGQLATAFFKGMKDNPYNIQNDGSFKLDLSQNTDLFDASGVRIRNWTTDSNGVADSGWFDQNYADDIKDNNFKVKGIVTGIVGKSKNNTEILLTNIADKGSKEGINKSATEKFYERNVDKKGIKEAKVFAVISDDKGNTFYKPIEGDAEKSAFSSYVASNLKVAKEARKNAFNTQQQKLKEMIS